MTTNYLTLYEGLKIFRDAMLPFIVEKLQAAYGDDWWEQGVARNFKEEEIEQLRILFEKRHDSLVVERPGDELAEMLDINWFGNIIEGNWKIVFKDAFHDRKVIGWLAEVREIRNAVAHPETGDLRADDAWRALDNVERILRLVNPTSAEEVQRLKDALRAPQKEAALPPWWQVAVPHRDIREGRFDAAVFAADLGMVLQDKGAVDYRDPVTFFKQTYPTRGLTELLVDIMRRLAGEPVGEAVIQLQTPFGGGKTHALLALYHLFTSTEQIEHLDAVRTLLLAAGLSRVPQASIAALVGTALDANEGRQTPEGLHIQTLWGEMAYQLGGAELYHLVEASDQDRVAPGTDRLGELLGQAGSALILIDEALEYQVKAAGVGVEEGTLAGQTLSFLQELTIAVANHPQSALVVTLPSSQLELFDEAAIVAHERLQRVIGRVETVRAPVEGVEVYEILRRRLFEQVGNPAEHRQVAEAYWEYYRRHAEDLPREVREPKYRELIVRAYPFHPELIAILYERWGSIPGFQRTRGVLRFLALVVGELYRQRHHAALIQPGHVDLGVQEIRRELVKYVGDAYETVLGSDVANHGAKAVQIDEALGSEYARERVAQGLATSIFLYSHSGGRERGGTEPQLRLAVLHPDMTPAIVADAVDRLSKRLWYLYGDGGVWRFSTEPNLNKILVEREDGVRREEINEEVRRTLGEIAGLRTFRRLYVWPQEDRDVTDTQELSLVVLDLDHPMGPENEEATRRFISQILDNHGTTFRRYRNTLVFLAPDAAALHGVTTAARTLIALRGIATDPVMAEQLREEQQKELTKRLDDARSQLPQRVAAAYRHIVTGGPEKSLQVWDMGAQAYDVSRTLSQRVWDTLKDMERLLEKLDPRLIVEERWALWPEDQKALRVVDLWGYFVRYTHLPMLSDQTVLTASIVEGLERRLFGYGLGDGEKLDFDTLYPPGGRPEGPVREIPASAWLVNPKVAVELAPTPPTEAAPPELPPEQPPMGPEPPERPVQPLLVTPEGERQYRRVVIRTPVRWENWQDFYNEVVDPLIREGAEVDIRVEVIAESESGIRENTVELGIRESLHQRGAVPEIEVE
jgi:predicted AAA+ superfamily ATPase